MSNFTAFLESTWLSVFFTSIVFIFIIVFKELGQRTRRGKTWERISYFKMLPRISLTIQHFSRKSDLLSVSTSGMCELVHKDMIEYLKIKKGYSDVDVEHLLQNKDQLIGLFQNDMVVLFLLNPESWRQSINIKPKLLDYLFALFAQTCEREKSAKDELLIELAFIILNFRKALDV